MTSLSFGTSAGCPRVVRPGAYDREQTMAFTYRMSAVLSAAAQGRPLDLDAQKSTDQLVLWAITPRVFLLCPLWVSLPVHLGVSACVQAPATWRGRPSLRGPGFHFPVSTSTWTLPGPPVP